jgi:hypothetical protein
VRSLQNVLLVIGSTALGTSLGYFGLILIIASMQRPGGEPWQAGFGQYLGGLICGAPLGSLAGLALCVGWIGTRDQPRVWSVFVWLGVLLGLALGPVVSSRWNIHQGTGCWGRPWLPPHAAPWADSSRVSARSIGTVGRGHRVERTVGITTDQVDRRNAFKSKTFGSLGPPARSDSHQRFRLRMSLLENCIVAGLEWHRIAFLPCPFSPLV